MSDEPPDPAPEPAKPPVSLPTNQKPTADREQAAELDEAARRAPIHERDQAPTFLLRSQAWLQSWLSNESRLVLGMVIVLLAVIALVVLSSTRFLRVLFDALDVVAFLGLFLVNWLGNGGVLVPIPGARFIGLLMIFQQAVLLPSWEVFAVSGAAMALGLASYYIAGVRTARSYAEGDSAAAEQLASDTGMLGGEEVTLSPAADLDAAAVTAIAGVDVSAEKTGDTSTGSATDSSDASSTPPPTRRGRLRKRFTTSLKKTQERAQPVIEQRGAVGMFLLCFAPTPMGTAAAYLGGLLRFGFTRYLAASFAAKYLLAGIIVLLALVFSDAARAVQIPEIEIPIIDITLFDDGVPEVSMPAASPSPAASLVPTPAAD